MTMKRSVCLVVPALILLTLLACSCASQGRQPAGITTAGTLAPCPGSPNCVSSEAEPGPAYIEPFPFASAPEAAWASLKRAVQGAGGSIEREGGDYMWAIYKTRLFRFADDMEFRMESTQGVIHVRSASRVGYSDFGVNRKRVEDLRQRFVNEQERLAKQSTDGTSP